MSYQGAFTPATVVSDVTTVPVPTAGANAYQHGQTWTAAANGFLQGWIVNRNDIVLATNYLDTIALTDKSRVDFAIGMPGGFPKSLDCHQLVVRLDFGTANPNVADWELISDYVRGLTLRRGRTTTWYDIASANVTIEVDNSSGRFSVFESSGEPLFRLNTGFYVGAIWRGVEYPLFKGRVKEYNEDDLPGQTGATFTGYDIAADLVFEVTSEYNAGDPSDFAGVRINKILDKALVSGPRNIQQGESTMTNYKTQRNFLDEIRVTAMSDGGLFFVDNDGTITYLDRNRISGRIREKGIVPYFSDSCEYDKLPYAAIEMVWNDAEFGNIVTVANVSQGQETPNAAIASSPSSRAKFGDVAWTPSQLVICNVESLQGLANFELIRRAYAFYRVNRFEVYPAHDDRIWAAMLSMRIGDSMIVQRTPVGESIPSIPAIPPFVKTDGYLTPTVGTVTTPDPGPLPAQFTLVFDTLGPIGTTNGTIVGQSENHATDRSWLAQRILNNGNANFLTYPTGAATPTMARANGVQAITGAREKFASSVTMNNAGTGQLTTWKDVGAGWVQVQTSNANGPFGTFDSSRVMRIGGITATVSPFEGKIYSVEMRTGLDPAAGTVVWRFDANDYPGTGTSYTDPRGRVWTLTNAAAITPKVMDPGTPAVPGYNPVSLIAEFVCDGIQIEATPEMWKFIVYCSPAVDILGRRYGDELYGDGFYGDPTIGLDA